MKQRLLAILLAVCVLTGCGGAPPASQTPPEPLDPAVFEDQSLQYFTDHPVNDGQPITLTMWVNEDWLESYRFLVREYQKYRPNVTVKMFSFPWNTYWTKLRLALQNGTGPDVFHMHNSFLFELQPYLEPLPEALFGEQVLEKSFDWVMADGQSERYCVNLGCATGGIFYNKQLWRQAGLTDADIPSTWEELETLAMRLTQYDANGKILVDGFNFKGETESLLFAMMAQKGQAVFNEASESRFLSGAGLESMEQLFRLVQQDRVCDMDQEPAKERFGMGKAAMIYGWSWVANDLALNYPDVEYGFFRIPAWSEQTPPAYEYHNFETSFCINNAASEQARLVAQDLLLFYLCNDDVQVNTACQAMIVPGKRSLREEHSNELGAVINRQIDYIDRTAYKGLVPTAVYDYLRVVLNNDVWDGTVDVSELLDAADQEVTNILQRSRFRSALPEYPYYSEFQN